MDVGKRRSVLVIVPTWSGRAPMLAAAMKVSDEVRKAEKIPIALALNREMDLKAELVEEMREIEQRMIIGKHVDEVVFFDPHTVELDDLVQLAQQCGLYVPRKNAA